MCLIIPRLAYDFLWNFSQGTELDGYKSPVIFSREPAMNLIFSELFSRKGRLKRA
jgi:hypothetical protein